MRQLKNHAHSPSTPRAPKDAEVALISLRQAIESEKERCFGEPFEERVQRVRHKRKALEKLIAANPDAKEHATACRDLLVHPQSPRARRAAVLQRGVGNRDAETLHSTTRRAARERLLGTTPARPQGSTRMEFQFGRSFGCWSGLPDVTSAVSEGYLGWRGLPRIVNDDTEETRGGSLLLVWSLRIPDTDTYIFESTPDAFMVALDYVLTGSGFWGLDASIQISITSGLHVPGAEPAGRAHSIVATDAKSTMFGESSDGLSQLFGLHDRHSAFALEAGTTVTYAIELEVLTWADGGTVQADVHDFWLPAVYDGGELWFSRSSGS